MAFFNSRRNWAVLITGDYIPNPARGENHAVEQTRVRAVGASDSFSALTPALSLSTGRGGRASCQVERTKRGDFPLIRPLLRREQDRQRPRGNRRQAKGQQNGIAAALM
jgi:hypothetical protein